MSHTSKTLKSIAMGEDYKALVTAIEKGDYQTLYDSYMRVAKLLEEAEKQIQDKIESLPRRNKDEDREKFRTAFQLRSKTTLPQWHWLKSEINKQKITEAQVIGLGKKGDPLAKTPEGRIVVLSGSQAKEGDKVTIRVMTGGEKLDFGSVFELTPESFYFILNSDTLQQVRDSLDSMRERVEHYLGNINECHLAKLGELLVELEKVRELSPKLQEGERERVIAKIMAYRKRLLNSSMEKLVFEYLASEEEKEIRDIYKNDEQQIASALSAPGLLRRQSYEAIKGGLFTGEELRGYSEVLDKMGGTLDTMSSAIAFMDFKAGFEGVKPKLQTYIEKMDRLVSGLLFRSRQLTRTLVNDETSSTEGLESKVKEAFSAGVLASELRRAFRNTEEYLDLRGAFLTFKEKLGDKEAVAAETAIRPYLRQKMAQVFGNKR